MSWLRHAAPAALIWGAVLLPALFLGLLAVRSADEQRIILERKETELRQQQTDQVASQIRLALGARFNEFSRGLDDQLGRIDAAQLASDFNTSLSAWWQYPGIGFSTTIDGRILSPDPDQIRPGTAVERFFSANRAFFANTQQSTVYQSVPTAQAELQKLQEYQSSDYASDQAPKEPATRDDSYRVLGRLRSVVPQKQARMSKEAAANWSNIAPSTSRFGELVSAQNEGVISRFVDDRLEIIFWKRPRSAPDTVFGVRLQPEDLQSLLETATETKPDPSVRFAVLNERAIPVLTVPASVQEDWKKPFVATEIGEILPQWETALYLADPGQLARAARSARLASAGLVLLALACMGLGMTFIALRNRQQAESARRKTDFVSNVSHELKTPLTSIRMFAEMLEEGRVTDPAKTAHYLRIIRQESERLTRLIHNVLDFAHMERGDKTYERQVIELEALLDHVWEGQSTHLENQGFALRRGRQGEKAWVEGDPDALAQVVVNLLSNAEKYSPPGGPREIQLSCRRHRNPKGKMDAWVVEIADRGLGVPSGQEEKIFERFHRAHDSLASGIPGAGLGLTLARRIIEDHGGTLVHRKRPGGGSLFTFTLPACPPPIPTL